MHLDLASALFEALEDSGDSERLLKTLEDSERLLEDS
jgi:hypothetical protein